MLQYEKKVVIKVHTECFYDESGETEIARRTGNVTIYAKCPVQDPNGSGIVAVLDDILGLEKVAVESPYRVTFTVGRMFPLDKVLDAIRSGLQTAGYKIEPELPKR